MDYLTQKLETQNQTQALETVASAPTIMACGLPLGIAKLMGIDPYKAPHANRGTPPRRHMQDRRIQRLRARAAFLGGVILNHERGIPAQYLNGWRQKLEQQERELTRRDKRSQLAEAA